ncbi:MAG TPA: TIGR04290 family methyltransferase [Isosphaeraceae bacterium]|nr:TIGR04290 family methyltransferase [Isosphaeraceae bacterium]
MKKTLQSHGPTPTTPRFQTIAERAPWFHNLHLPDGTQTAPDHPFGDFPRFKWEQIAPHLPKDLTGWRALDIGCNAGFYSFELARRGASVTGIDSDPHYLDQAIWAASEFGLLDRMTFRQMQVYDLAHEPEPFDLVLFMGVFYHLRYPMLGLDIVARRVRRLLVFQTLSMPEETVLDIQPDLDFEDRALMTEPGWPTMAFIEHRLAGDPTNWWAPNQAAIEAMLRSTGLAVTQNPGHEIYLCVPCPPTSSQWNNSLNTELSVATGQRRRCASS